MKAIPKITVRIDRGEDWVEISGDWQPDLKNGPHGNPTCGEGAMDDDWLNYLLLDTAWRTLNEAVME